MQVAGDINCLNLLVMIFLKSIGYLNFKFLYFVGILQVLGLAFSLFRIFEHSPMDYRLITYYGKCSKISYTSYLPKRPRQIGQTKIRLLLKKQSDQGLPYLLL